MRRVIASKDFLAGILYMTFGLLGLWLGRDLEAGTAESMGRGIFPPSDLRASHCDRGSAGGALTDARRR